MGRPAARVGDDVAHKLPPVLTGGPGSPDVIIGGMPAWRGIPLGAVSSLPPPTEEAPPEPELTEEEKAAKEEEEKDMTEEEIEAKEKEEAEKEQEAKAAEMASIGGAADIHACTQPSPIPFCVDGPGVVMTGSATVLINGLPACRQGDLILEILGPPNTITGGCPTVVIGG